jgi:dTDP-glucose 4,6-dehydratase
MNLLVTGGAGFIGSNFVRYWTEKFPEDRITVLDAFTYAGSIDNLPPGAYEDLCGTLRVWYGNVCNAELVDSLVEDADVVVHFAAETHVTRSIFDNMQFFHTDVIGTQTVANAIVKAGDRVKLFLHISTSEVYGTALDAAMDEDHPLNPMSPYAAAKCGADRLVYSYWKTYGLPAVIVRPFNNYGPRQHLEKVVPRFVTSVILGEDITVHGDGSAARDFIHVDDTCRALDAIINAPSEKVVGDVFNLASGEHRSIAEIAQAMVEEMDCDPAKIKFIGDRPGQVFRHTGDSTKILDRLGWKPIVPWSEGLRSTIDWFQNNRPWWEKQIWLRRIPIKTKSGKVEFH